MLSASILEIQSPMKEETNHNPDDANVGNHLKETSINSGYETPDKSREKSMQFPEVRLNRNYILMICLRSFSLSTTPSFW